MLLECCLFTGSKMNVNSRLDSHQVCNGEFVVLVPFAKKNQQLSSPPVPADESTIPPLCSQGSSMSSAANSAWLDMMSELYNIPSDSAIPSSSSYLQKFSLKKEGSMSESSEWLSTNTRKKRKVDGNHALHNILSSDSKDAFDEQTCMEISRFVGSANCLSNSMTGKCLLFERLHKEIDMECCMCPSWLKKVLKCFSFLNIFYAFFHSQQKCLTWKVIEEAMKHPSNFGLDDVRISDMENLSILSPKLVVILGTQKPTKMRSGSVITIGDSSVGSAVPCESTQERRIARKCTSTLVNAIEKRSFAFRTDLWTLILCSMEKVQPKRSMPLALSLDNLLALIKNGIHVPVHNKSKSEKPRSSTSGCHGAYNLEPSRMVDHLREGIGKDGEIVHVEHINAKEAVYVELPNDLSDSCRTALKCIGISRLYSHQAEAIQASISGKNIVVATSTSSGKSLCYNVPVLDALSMNLSSCALYIFPTKALAQDQLRALRDMTKSLDINLNIGVYDGDTSQEDRVWVRDNARLLITNPDMLHTSILPYHTKFQRFLSNLRKIVIDEAHVYKGAFGCHTALVLRRLCRICSHVYGSAPSFILSTATSANPREHAMELANLQTLELIQNDGSPCGQKYFLLWNPSLRSVSNLRSRNDKSTIKELCTRRSSPMLEVSHLFAEMVRHGLRCIAFCKTRKQCELVLCYTREILQVSSPNLVDSICVYRGGYTPELRRNIEKQFFGGKLMGVAATNALELGIDVGHIDATLHLGFPGSVASLWQQAGRSGRKSRPSLAIYVAFESPLDQYFMRLPHKLFDRPIEHCQVDGQNQKVLEQHIACAAFELPLCTEYDEKYFGSALDGAITALKNKGYLGSDQLEASSTKMWNYIGPEVRPSTGVSLRAIETEKYKVIDQLRNEVLEEIEESKAFFQVYEGAVYMHQGFSYLVKTLNLSEKVAYCQKADLKYYTKTQDSTNIHVFGGDLAYPPVEGSEFKRVRTTAQVHSCKVTTRWFGFHRVWKSSSQVFDTVQLSLPQFSYESEATWIRVPQSIKETFEIDGLVFHAGLHAASHALLNVVPLYVMCNSSDLSTECANPHETRRVLDRLLLYDKHPGGIGITKQVQLLFREFLTAALELISTCSCLNMDGCPNCVQTLLCSAYNENLNKIAAATILKGVIESEAAYFASRRDSPESSKKK